MQPTVPFLFTDDHLAFQDATRHFLRKTFADSIADRAFSDEYPRYGLKQLGAVGLTGLAVPEEHGGQGADCICLGIACEEAGWADPSIAYLVFSANVGADLINRLALPAVRDAVLPGVLDGEQIVCAAITEPGCGSDVAAMRTKAERVEGGWRLTGEKTSVTQAVHADLAIVFALTDPAQRARGVSAFLVDLHDPTISRQRFTDPGLRSLGRGSITMDGTFVPDDHLLGEPGRGFHAVMHEFDLTRTLIAAMTLGTGQRAIDMAAAYSVQRETFGRPIAGHQGVSFPIAEHSTYLEGVRWLTYRALALRQAGHPHTKEAAMLKWWAPEVAFNAIKDAIIIHGQVGWSDEMPLQAMLRDVSGYFIGDGTPQINKLVIAREVIGPEALAR
jgi:cyclohexanecarboxyl-CoA dehydrogenase